MYALVDDADAPLVNQYRWHVAVEPTAMYARRKWRDADGIQRQQFMHTLIMGGKGFDHADHDGLNNQRSNLRPATAAQQVQNRRKTTGRWSSDYKGVFWHKHSGMWHSVIRHDKRLRSLGYFSDERAAAEKYDDAAHVLFGEFAVLNFPNRAPQTWDATPRRRGRPRKDGD